VFLFLGEKYGKRKVHNMLLLMLVHGFKNLHLMSSFISFEKVMSLLTNMIKNFISHVIIICTPCLKISFWARVLMKIAI
jgi:hypothetical protein